MPFWLVHTFFTCHDYLITTYYFSITTKLLQLYYRHVFGIHYCSLLPLLHSGHYYIGPITTYCYHCNSLHSEQLADVIKPFQSQFSHIGEVEHLF